MCFLLEIDGKIFFGKHLMVEIKFRQIGTNSRVFLAETGDAAFTM